MRKERTATAMRSLRGAGRNRDPGTTGTGPEDAEDCQTEERRQWQSSAGGSARSQTGDQGRRFSESTR
jgi:hypothetical protein